MELQLIFGIAVNLIIERAPGLVLGPEVGLCLVPVVKLNDYGLLCV